MTREERENAIRCLKMWIEKEPYLQTYKTCLEALEQEPCDECKYKIFTELYFHTDPEMVDQEPMREFTEEEAKAYSKALDRIYKPTGFNVFNEPCDDACKKCLYAEETDGSHCYECVKGESKFEQEPCEDEDAVSRQYLLDLATSDGAYDYVSASEIINAPSVQPKAIECEDAISRQAVINAIKSVPSGNWTNKRYLQEIDKLPSVQPKAKTGHWIEMKRGYLETPSYECSECGKIIYAEKENFCPKCGKKMVKSQESEE